MGKHLITWSVSQRICKAASWMSPRLASRHTSEACYNQSLPGMLESTKRCRYYTTQAQPENLLLKHLKARIKSNGPMPVADYMKEVLTNAYSGYYMHKDVFGKDGDFITSPEVSQMFGEMLGVWVVNEWMNNYNGQTLQLVELGPGRGTLADDMLRVFCQFPSIKDKISLHLVEVSPALGQMQASKLTGKDTSEVEEGDSDCVGAYRNATSKYGIDVSWYRSLADVPQGLSCFIAHEFLDALPIHKFQKTEAGWREVLVDEDPGNPDALRFVLAHGKTPASVALLQVESEEQRNHIEVCPSAGLTVQEICQRIQSDGGMALLADYGHSGEKGDTFRAFKRHKLHEDPLSEPGSADLTADVDFSYLKSFTNADVDVFGPVTQEKYLINMGIGVRLQALLQKSSQEHWPSLISGFKMLTSPDQMGERFKFMSILGKTGSSYKPAGFVELNYGDGQGSS
ncbi:protein arginine methyltransferase NDUFAF7, mitochondrial [Aplysia californica]|uniref:Protein arginine methyltransferase NDUFAF7 n=1 Tax=Aplysia californica TaxID=6500 RepID=A0ABM1A6Q4_APLCA|nr:protein arginine methyltransferase NDUFAF7, mitochondrial [Aplysia californica]XP_005105436.1 protein arginine methyltransferase NDUFAF7, mitochondrial [Aplysia californica]XP_012941897.1 protein arginine methyltransferase NDUFAF7, mitochondrial [Aplysia californica]XP_035827488.1 protein arginine methyltransferase NDUFAF7, mitochondrial [Aplysia californica]